MELLTIYPHLLHKVINNGAVENKRLMELSTFYPQVINNIVKGGRYIAMMKRGRVAPILSSSLYNIYNIYII